MNINDYIYNFDELIIPKGLDVELEKMISMKLDKLGIYYQISSRIKSKDSIRKKQNKKYYHTDNIVLENGEIERPHLIQDFVGVRITLYFVDDLDVVKAILDDVFNGFENNWNAKKGKTDSFAPAKFNGVFKIPDKLLRDNEKDNWLSYCIDDTFEVQLKTVLFNSWHEIEHDLRYKNKDIWEIFEEYDRKFNSILASIELCDDSIVSVLDRLAYDTYKRYKYYAVYGEEMSQKEKNIWFLDRVTQLHFHLKQQNLEEVFERKIAALKDSNDSELANKIETALKEKDEHTLLYEYFYNKINFEEKNSLKKKNDCVELLIKQFNEYDFVKQVLKYDRKKLIEKLHSYRNNLPINTFTICSIVYLDVADELSSGKNINKKKLNKLKEKLDFYLKNETIKYNVQGVIPVIKYKTYPTYQCEFEISKRKVNQNIIISEQSDEVKADEVFAKVIDKILIWLNKKLNINDYSDNDKNEYYNFINYINDLVEGKIDKTNECIDISLPSEYDIKIFYNPQGKCAFRLINSGLDDIALNGRRSYIAAGRLFITDIAVDIVGDHVKLAVNVSCRCSELSRTLADSYRPGFVMDLYNENVTLCIKEFGSSDELIWKPFDATEFKDGIIKYQDYEGKRIRNVSNIWIYPEKLDVLCSEIKDFFFDSESHKLPVVFISKRALAKKKDNTLVKSEFVPEKLGRKLLGYAHVIIEDDSIIDEFSDRMSQYPLFAKSIKNENVFIYNGGLYNDDNCKVFEVDDYDYDYMILAYDIEKYVKNNMVDMYYSFNNVSYYEDLKLAYYKDRMGDLDDNQKAYLKELTINYENSKKEIEDLKEKSKEKDLRIKEKDNKITSLKGLIDENKKQLKSNDEGKKKNKQDKNKAEVSENKVIYKISENLKKMYIEEGILRERANIINNQVDNIIDDWIRPNMGDYIVIRREAENSYNDYSIRGDREKFKKRMIDIFIILYFYSKYKNGEIGRDEYDCWRERYSYGIDPLKEKGLENYSSYYINLHKKKVFLNEHIGNGEQGIECIKVYFVYDDIDNKIVIGSMPDHLATTKDKFGNRK